ncbi:MAG TPA: MgtC/SapB family protein [Caulobacteraceae bacterium]
MARGRNRNAAKLAQSTERSGGRLLVLVDAAALAGVDAWLIGAAFANLAPGRRLGAMTTLGELIANLAFAWAAGSLIGLERTYNGRVAGFRTHGLVSLAAAVAMSIAYLPLLRPGSFPPGTVLLDPSRVSQGVMTGVGFIGAGVIFKEGVTVQGLTTAASIWTTAAIGQTFGMGLWAPAAAGTVLVLVILVVQRKIEGMVPSRALGLATLRFEADKAPGEAGLNKLLGYPTNSLENFSYSLAEGGRVVEYRADLNAPRQGGFADVLQRLKSTPGLIAIDLERISK